MKLIIAGGRNYFLSLADIDRLYAVVDLDSVTEIVSGCATGADACGEHLAKMRGIPVKRFPANWKEYGKSAGPMRNKEMAEYSDAVALFPGGRGTDNMYKQAKQFGLTIYDFRLP